MNEMILNAIYILIGLILAIGAFITSLNFLMKGMPMAYLKVRLSNGKKVLVRVNSTIDKYWTTGIIKDNILDTKFRNDKTEIKVNNVNSSHYYWSMGVHCIDIQESKTPFAYLRTGEVPTPDLLPNAKVFDTLLQLARMSPKKQQKEFIILLIVIILTLCVAAYAAYEAHRGVVLIEALKALSGNI